MQTTWDGLFHENSFVAGEYLTSVKGGRDAVWLQRTDVCRASLSPALTSEYYILSYIGCGAEFNLFTQTM